jgi:hypothetical protein
LWAAFKGVKDVGKVVVISRRSDNGVFCESPFSGHAVVNYFFDRVRVEETMNSDGPGLSATVGSG